MSSKATYYCRETLGMSNKIEIFYYGYNTYGAKIYKNPINGYLVRVKDHLSKFERYLCAKYQGNIYMSPSGIMYLVVEDPTIVDALGFPMTNLPKFNFGIKSHVCLLDLP